MVERARSERGRDERTLNTGDEHSENHRAARKWLEGVKGVLQLAPVKSNC